MLHTLARYDGFCADCDLERPLVLVEHGPRGVRAWLEGVGAEDRALSYTCLVCGRSEHVPLTDAEDEVYAAGLLTWPDTFLDAPVPVMVEAPSVELAPRDVFAVAAVHLATQVATLTLVPEPAPIAEVIELPAARRPVVRMITLPRQRVSATDDLPLALAVA